MATAVSIYQYSPSVPNAKQQAASPLFVPGELGLECLKAMPFEPKRAVSFVKEYRKYMQFQSTVDILKNPPADYPMPPTDLLGGLDEIEQKAGAGMYESQYEFDRELQSLVYSAFDGHLSVQLCSYSVFGGFVNKASLVSISSNGTTLPEVYVSSMRRF